MSWLAAPEVEVTCVHVACDGGPCQYVPQPPAIGPDVPECIIAADGSCWTNGGRLYYSGKPGGGYLIATVTNIVRAYSGTAQLAIVLDEFPAGPWVDGHKPLPDDVRVLHEAWQQRLRDAQAVNA